MKKKIELKAKLEAIKTYIYSLQKEYEKCEKTKVMMIYKVIKRPKLMQKKIF